jgi:hypothetical protein
VTAGTANDGVDRWNGATFDATKIVGASGAHSWFVFKSPTGIATGGPYYCIIDLNNATISTFVLVFSNAAPTGGTTSARPTATDEWTYNTTLPDVTASATHRISRVTDANGNFFMYGARAGTGIVNHLMAGQPLTDLPTGTWTRPWVSWWDNTNDGSRGVGGLATSQLGRLSSNDGNRGIQGRGADGLLGNTGAVIGGGIVNFGTTSNDTNTIMSATNTNPISGTVDMWPCFYGIVDTASKRYFAGRFEDCFQVNKNHATGDVFPGSGTIERVLLNNLLIPCGGVTPLI